MAPSLRRWLRGKHRPGGLIVGTGELAFVKLLGPCSFDLDPILHPPLPSSRFFGVAISLPLAGRKGTSSSHATDGMDCRTVAIGDPQGFSPERQLYGSGTKGLGMVSGQWSVVSGQRAEVQ